MSERNGTIPGPSESSTEASVPDSRSLVADEATLAPARALLSDLGLAEDRNYRARPHSGHNSSVLLPCVGEHDQRFMLKWFVPPADGRFYPPGVRLADYARREGAFYRFLDSIDPQRRELPVPRTILIDPSDPPAWLLLESIEGAVGPAEEVLSAGHVLELIQALRSIRLELVTGRRDFPLNHWDLVGLRDRVRMMYDPVLDIVGDQRWRRTQDFFHEATRWAESRPPVLVHGDFTEDNIVVDPDGNPFLVDFERVGIGHEDHDFAWLWIHSRRPQTWKRGLLERYLGRRVGSERIRAEWGIRSSLVYLALRRLRFGHLKTEGQDPQAPGNLALLDAALTGGGELFPV